MDKAIPLALILNELINNSHKHAFVDSLKAEIKVTFKELKNSFEFQYEDNGTFKKKDDEERVSMGMKIINMMVSQLQGKIDLNTNENFNLIINFPKK